jgi:hypothetical protein
MNDTHNKTDKTNMKAVQVNYQQFNSFYATNLIYTFTCWLMSGYVILQVYVTSELAGENTSTKQQTTESKLNLGFHISRPSKHYTENFEKKHYHFCIGENQF